MLKELRNKKAQKVAAAKAILDDAGDGLLAEDKQAEYDTLLADIEALDKRIKAQEKLADIERSMPAAGDFSDNAAIEVGENKALEYESLGEFLQDVAQAALPGSGGPSQRLRYNSAASGHNTSVNSDGGFLVRRDFTLDLMKAAEAESVLVPLCTQVEIGEGSDGLEAPFIDETSRATGSRFGGVRVYRRAEADTVTSSKLKLGKHELRLEDLMAITYTTERALQDAVSLQSFITQAYAAEFAFTIDDEIIRGTGAGQCLGLLNAGALISVAKESGQDAATIVYENVRKMHNRMLPRSRQRAVWLINADAEEQLESMVMVIGTGGVPVWLPAGGISGDGYGTLYRRPVIQLEQCSALGSVGDILFADLSQYLYIKKGGLKTQSSMHVRFIYDEMTFKFTTRCNGMPIQRSALTPYKGSNTRSPYVALAERA